MDALIDTNIVSYIFKSDTRGELYLPYLIKYEPHISFITLAELFEWGDVYKWNKKKKESLEDYLIEQYTIIHSDEAICINWASMRTEMRQKGRTIQYSDAWIAAIAITYKIPIITHNRKHFEGIKGLKVISEA